MLRVKPATGTLAILAALLVTTGCSSDPNQEMPVPQPRDYGPGEAVSYVAKPGSTAGKDLRYRVSFTMPDDVKLNMTFSRYRNDEGVRATWTGTNGKSGEANAGALFTGPTIEAAMSTGKIGAFGGPDKVTGTGEAPNGNVWVAARPTGYEGANEEAYLRIANRNLSTGTGAETTFYGMLVPTGPMGEKAAIRLAETVKFEKVG